MLIRYLIAALKDRKAQIRSLHEQQWERESLWLKSPDESRHFPKYQQLVSAIAETAQRIFTPVPKVFLLDSSKKIIACDNKMAFAEDVIDHLTLPELKTIAAHEFRHLIYDMKVLSKPRNQQMEREADAFSVLVTGDPQSLISALRKLAGGEDMNKSSRFYPSLKQRIETLQRLKEGKSTPAMEHVKRLESKRLGSAVETVHDLSRW